MPLKEANKARKPRLRLSIRYKILFIIVAVLLTTLGTHLYLATRLFRQDKLAYVYDLNSSLVESLSEQTRSSLTLLVREMNLFVRDITRPGASDEDREAFAADLFKQDRGLLRLEVYGADGARQGAYVNHQRLDELGVTPVDLEELRKQRPLPLPALLAKGGHLHVQNSSLPPDAAILTMALSFPGDPPLVLAVDFSHERLLRIFGRSKMHETYLVDERGEVLAHPDPKMVIGRSNLSKQGLVSRAIAGKVEQGVLEFTDEGGSVFLGAYARVGVGRLAVLSQIPRDDALRATDDLIYRSFLFGLAILIGAFIVSVFFSRLLTSPIRRLRAATAEIGEGRYDVEMGIRSRDEIGELAHAFEDMTEAIQEAQIKLVRSEKMAAFGQLGAGITHEVKNPMTGIIGFAQLGQMNLDDKAKAKEMFALIEKEAKRCTDILVNFLKFARADTQELGILQPNAVVEDSAKICRHQLMVNKVQLEVELAPDTSPIRGNTAELQQVLLNLAINAQQAMTEGGKVRIGTSDEGDGFVRITVSDDGPGIPEDLQDRIFEPFFTTKQPGEGTGLGLSIVFGIIRDHHGKITVDSETGKGTTFTIHLPAEKAQERGKVQAEGETGGTDG